MRARTLVHLSDGVLVRELKALAGREREATAAVVAHMAEIDSRKLYLPAGYSSMYTYCVQELHFSEDAAYKRIAAARAVRKFPAMLDALADGRLHLSGVKLLVPHLTPANAEELTRAAEDRTRNEIEQLLAERFPRTESLPMVEAVGRPSEFRQLAPPMKTGCQDRRVADPDSPNRRSPAVYSGSARLPHVSLRRAGSHTGLRAEAAAQGARQDHPLTIQRRLR